MYTQKNDKMWRNFQSAYLLERKRENGLVKTAGRIALILTVLLLTAGIYLYIDTSPEDGGPGHPPQNAAHTDNRKQPAEEKAWLSKNQLNTIIRHTSFNKTDKNIFFVDTLEKSYKVTTSIDITLQEYLLSVMDRLKKLTRGKPQRIACVVMEADTGKIIAMTGFDLENPDANPCIESNYPAASIFKIITAAAAVETLGYTPETPLYFNGNKYTLYKRQLKEIKNKYSYKISFSRAFAESVNPVFGKIGKNYLGKEKLESYAHAFGFNQVVESELPFVSGSFEANDSDYHLAELGCGFNTDTTISPVFGAMLTSAIINSGNVMLPSIVEHVTDTDGEILYKNKTATYKSAISPETASTLMQLMKRTVAKGTAKKSFKGYSKDKVLSKLIIGGKTGSLYNKAHTVKYDWFTGFGREKKTNRQIAVAIVVGHRKYIGTRATTYAKMILKQYFKKSTETTAQLR